MQTNPQNLTSRRGSCHRRLEIITTRHHKASPSRVPQQQRAALICHRRRREPQHARAVGRRRRNRRIKPQAAIGANCYRIPRQTANRTSKRRPATHKLIVERKTMLGLNIRAIVPGAVKKAAKTMKHSVVIRPALGPHRIAGRSFISQIQHHRIRRAGRIANINPQRRSIRLKQRRGGICILNQKITRLRRNTPARAKVRQRHNIGAGIHRQHLQAAKAQTMPVGQVNVTSRHIELEARRSLPDSNPAVHRVHIQQRRRTGRVLDAKSRRRVGRVLEQRLPGRTNYQRSLAKRPIRAGAGRIIKRNRIRIIIVETAAKRVRHKTKALRGKTRSLTATVVSATNRIVVGVNRQPVGVISHQVNRRNRHRGSPVWHHIHHRALCQQIGRLARHVTVIVINRHLNMASRAPARIRRRNRAGGATTAAQSHLGRTQIIGPTRPGSRPRTGSNAHRHRRACRHHLLIHSR